MTLPAGDEGWLGGGHTRVSAPLARGFASALILRVDGTGLRALGAGSSA